jgi:hypothetical protein
VRSRVTVHFIERVAERLGPEEDAVRLGERLVEAVINGDSSVASFVTRVDRTGNRVFAFTARSGRTFYAVIDTQAMVCVTLMPPGFTVRRPNKNRLLLEDARN